MGANGSRDGRGYDAIVLDLDGTLYRGDEAIPGAPEAVAELRAFAPCRFLSNNGECVSSTLARRLARLGFAVREDEIRTSADLVLQRLQAEMPAARVLALVSAELARTLRSNGLDVRDDADVDVVAVGVDRELTRHRMVLGLEAMLGGARLIATNEDPTYPSHAGVRPAAGAYVGFFRGMGFEPTWRCGKPDRGAVEAALRAWDLPLGGRYLFVGDNLHSDVAAADELGADSALVLSGVARRKDVAALGACPTAIVEDVVELADLLRSSGGEVVSGRRSKRE
ncbi:MAG: HAD-IIA family hydrolase [Candidatus Bipolaricaulota bacterium]